MNVHLQKYAHTTTRAQQPLGLPTVVSDSGKLFYSLIFHFRGEVTVSLV